MAVGGICPVESKLKTRNRKTKSLFLHSEHMSRFLLVLICCIIRPGDGFVDAVDGRFPQVPGEIR